MSIYYQFLHNGKQYQKNHLMNVAKKYEKSVIWTSTECMVEKALIQHGVNICLRHKKRTPESSPYFPERPLLPIKNASKKKFSQKRCQGKFCSQDPGSQRY